MHTFLTFLEGIYYSYHTKNSDILKLKLNFYQDVDNDESYYFCLALVVSWHIKIYMF